MKSIALKGDPRTDLGKSANKKLRKSGQVPCVLYGGDDHVNFSVYEVDFKNLVYTPNTYLVRLEVDNVQRVAVLQDIQFHPVSEQIIHADFLEVQKDKPVTLKVPVNIIGVAPGVKEGGKLQVKIQKLLVRGLPENLPDSIDININSLDLGKNIRVREIKVDNIELLDTPENSIVTCGITRASRSAAAGFDEFGEPIEEGAVGTEGGEGGEGQAEASSDEGGEKKEE